MIVLVMFYVAMAVIAVATLAASVALFFLGQAWQPMLVLVVGSSMFYPRIAAAPSAEFANAPTLALGA